MTQIKQIPDYWIHPVIGLTPLSIFIAETNPEARYVLPTRVISMQHVTIVSLD